MTQINSANIIASLIGKGREDEALEMYHSLGIDTADGYMAVLDILSQRGDDLRLLDLSCRGAQQFTAHAGIHAIYVQALLKVGDASAAAKTAETFMERSGNQGLWALWAESLLGAYEFEKAGAVLKQYMPQNPFNAGAWIVTARLLWLHPIPDTKNVLQGLEQEIEDHSLEYSIDHGRMHFAAGLIHEAIGDQLTCVFVDHGLMRMNEAEQVVTLFRDHYNIPLVHVNAEERFLGGLAGQTDPEKKRKFIGGAFIDLFEAEAKKIGGADFLAQGTLYPDVIESVSFTGGPSVTIKSHHNVGGLPEYMKLKLVEPLRELFKDEAVSYTHLTLPTSDLV